MKQASKASDVTDLDFDLFGEEPTSGDGKEEKKGDRGLESNVQAGHRSKNMHPKP